jgi:hypothetical protein
VTRQLNGCEIERETGDPRYFGNPNYPSNPVQYRSQWWRVIFPDRTWCLCGTLAEAAEYIGRVGYAHRVPTPTSDLGASHHGQYVNSPGRSRWPS